MMLILVSILESFRRYIMKTKLKNIQYKILDFNPMVLRGKVKPDSSRPDLLHPVSFGLISDLGSAIYIP